MALPELLLMCDTKMTEEFKSANEINRTPYLEKSNIEKHPKHPLILSTSTTNNEIVLEHYL